MFLVFLTDQFISLQILKQKLKAHYDDPHICTGFWNHKQANLWFCFAEQCYREVATEWNDDCGNHSCHMEVVCVAWNCVKNNYADTRYCENGVSDDGKFYPDRGDIVQISGKTILVLTKEKHNRQTHSLTGVCLVDGKADITSLATITYVRTIPELVEKADKELTDNVIKDVRALFK